MACNSSSVPASPDRLAADSSFAYPAGTLPETLLPASYKQIHGLGAAILTFHREHFVNDL
jgi:hypothetical protein